MVVVTLGRRRACGGRAEAVRRAGNLVANAPLAKEGHPVVHPSVRLRRCADRVVNSEAELPFTCLGGERLGQMHLRHRAAKRLGVRPAADVEVLHHDVRAARESVVVVVYRWDRQAARSAERLEPEALAQKHLGAILAAASFDEELSPVLERVRLDGCPAAAAAAALLCDCAKPDRVGRAQQRRREQALRSRAAGSSAAPCLVRGCRKSTFLRRR
jgi:hypothetical protein